MFPTYLFKDKESKVFTDQAEHDAALEDGWKDSPDAIVDEPDADAEKADLIAQLASLGVEADKRLGVKRLNEEIEKALADDSE